MAHSIAGQTHKHFIRMHCERRERARERASEVDWFVNTLNVRSHKMKRKEKTYKNEKYVQREEKENKNRAWNNSMNEYGHDVDFYSFFFFLLRLHKSARDTVIQFCVIECVRCFGYVCLRRRAPTSIIQ